MRSPLTSLLLAVPVAAFMTLITACSGGTSEIGSTPSGTGKGSSSGSTTTAPSEAPPRETPQPSFTGSNAGCSNISAYRASSDGTQWIGIVVDKNEQGLVVDGSKKTIDLGSTPAGVEVFVDVYNNPPSSQEYCTDFHTATPIKTRWLAQAGLLTIELTADASAPKDTKDTLNPTYRATLRLERVHFTGPEGGVAVIVPNVVIENVRVGWLPG